MAVQDGTWKLPPSRDALVKGLLNLIIANIKVQKCSLISHVYAQKMIFLFHVQVNGAKNLMSIEQRQSITLVPCDFVPQHSSSAALSEDMF